MLAYMIQFDMLFWTSWCDNRKFINSTRSAKTGICVTPRLIPLNSSLLENKLFNSPDPNVKSVIMKGLSSWTRISR